MTDPALLNHPSPLLIIDPSYTGNVGDSMISYGQLVLAERMGYLNHTECGFLQSVGLNDDCNNFTHVADGGLALWQGGGNWHPVRWSEKGWSKWRMMSFIKLMEKGKTIIGMPQSLHYMNKKYEVSEAKEWMEATAADANKEKSKEKLILSWRQYDSFHKGSSLYPLLDNRLVPDIAFMIGPLEETKVWTKKDKSIDIIFFLRDDHESLYINQRNWTMLRRMLNSNEKTKELSFNIVDWYDRYRFINETAMDSQQPNLKYKVRNFDTFINH
jgi:exopolysaccharide biosynthesis predicted pyruvyltransferase EpsI